MFARLMDDIFDKSVAQIKTGLHYTTSLLKFIAKSDIPKFIEGTKDIEPQHLEEMKLGLKKNKIKYKVVKDKTTDKSDILIMEKDKSRFEKTIENMIVSRDNNDKIKADGKDNSKDREDVSKEKNISKKSKENNKNDVTRGTTVLDTKKLDNHSQTFLVKLDVSGNVMSTICRERLYKQDLKDLRNLSREIGDYQKDVSKEISKRKINEKIEKAANKTKVVKVGVTRER